MYFGWGDEHDLYYKDTDYYGLVSLWTDGVLLSIKEDPYMVDILNIDEDEHHYFTMAFHPGDAEEHLEWEELDYICDRIGGDDLEEIVTLLQYLDPSVNKENICEEAALSDLLTKYFKDDWDYIGNEILYEMGYGLGQYRAETLKADIEDEMTIIPESIHGGFKLKLTYSQLLGLISQFDLKSFSDLFGEGFNNIDIALGDAWHDEWGYSDDTTLEINKLMKKLVERIQDDSKIDLDTRKKHHDEQERVIKELGFVESSNWDTGIFSMERVLEDFKGDMYTIYYRLTDFNPIDTTVTLYVGTDKPYNHGYSNEHLKNGKSYKIKMSEVSDYVLSGDLYAPEQMRIARGEFDGDTEILKSREGVEG